MWFIQETLHGFRVVWLPANTVGDARKAAEEIGLSGYIAPGLPFVTYESAKSFCDSIPMWAIGR